MGKRKIIGIVIIAVVLIGGGLGIKFMGDINDYQESMKTLVINEINIENVADGEYIGEYDANIISAKVRVNVKNHEIMEVELLEHNNGRGKPAEKILGNIIKEQSVKVDTVSGATNSSKAILKAVENALNN